MKLETRCQPASPCGLHALQSPLIMLWTLTKTERSDSTRVVAPPRNDALGGSASLPGSRDMQSQIVAVESINEINGESGVCIESSQKKSVVARKDAYGRVGFYLFKSEKGLRICGRLRTFPTTETSGAEPF